MSFIAWAISAATSGASIGTLSDSSGEVVSWGDNTYHQLMVPSGSYGAIDANQNFSLAIRSDGTIVGWGDNSFNQTVGAAGVFTGVAAGGYHGLGLRPDGTVTGWGFNSSAQITIPPGFYSAISAGDFYSLAIRTDGTLAGWGSNTFGQTTVPSGVFSKIAAGSFHALGIRADGTLAGWGDNSLGQAAVPIGTFTAIAAGAAHSLALRTDGSLATWGFGDSGLGNVPSGTFTAIAAGGLHSLAIRSSGALVGWGDDSAGQTNVPSGVYVAVAAGSYHSLALKAKTTYGGDLDIFGTGANANLNRSISVTGNMTVETNTTLYNNPTAQITGSAGSGKLVIKPGAAIQGQGQIIAQNGIDLFAALNLASGATIVTNGPISGSHPINLNSGSSLVFGASQTNAAGGINVASGATAGIIARGETGNVIAAQPALVTGAGDPSGYIPGDKYVITSNVTVAAGGKFDVNDGILVINSGTFSAVNAAVHSGAIFSSTVQYDSNNLLGLTGLGMGDNFDLSYAGIAANNQLTITGSLIPAASDFGQQFIFKYTYIGDANLDGKVTTSDYDFVFGNLGSTTNGVTGNPVIWGDGDFNGNGVVDTTDLDNLFANLGFGTTGNVQPPLLPGTSVPEPSSVALLLLGLAGSAAVIRRKK